MVKERIPILIAGYPKSGTTWLTRLVGDALDSPTGGSVPSEDRKEVATEGHDRPGPYVVRKGHYRLMDDNGGPAVPAPHRLAWRRLDREKVIFIVRDPRDLCVSGASYWRVTVEQFLDRMITEKVAELPRWDKYVEGWMEGKFPFVMTRYEDLLEDAESELKRILTGLALDHDGVRVSEAATRQSFAARKDHYEGKLPDLHQRIMREGRAGAWAKHFTRRLGQECQTHFGATMTRLGYVTDQDWWKTLEK